MDPVKRQTHTIDAENQVLGRLAVKIALLLRGKQKPDFANYKDIGDFVILKNILKIKVTGKKMEQKKYYSHSGYPGGLKTKTMKDIFKKNPGEVLKKAVFGMLPKNKLRSKMILRLKIEK